MTKPSIGTLHAPLREVADWLEQYREIWEGRLDRLALELRDIQRNADGDE